MNLLSLSFSFQLSVQCTLLLYLYDSLSDSVSAFVYGQNVSYPLQMLMNASPQMLVEPIVSVITPLDRTDVNAQLDLLLTTAVHKTHNIQSVSVRS